MTTADYVEGRVKYRRPQALLFSEDPGTLVNNIAASGLTATISQGSKSILVLSGNASAVQPGQTIIVTSSPNDNIGIVGLGAKVEQVESSQLGTLITLSVAHQKSGPIVFSTATYSFVPAGSEFENFLVISDHNRSDLDFSPQRIEKRDRMINGRMRSYHVADKMKLTVSWNNIPSRAFPTMPTFDANGKPNVEPYTVDGGAGGNDLLKWYEDHVGSFWVYLAYDKYINFGSDTQAYGHMAQYNQVMEMYIADFSHKVSKRGALYDMWDVSITLEEA